MTLIGSPPVSAIVIRSSYRDFHPGKAERLILLKIAFGGCDRGEDDLAHPQGVVKRGHQNASRLGKALLGDPIRDVYPKLILAGHGDQPAGNRQRPKAQLIDLVGSEKVVQILGVGVNHLALSGQQLRFNRQRIIDPLAGIFPQNEIAGV